MVSITTYPSALPTVVKLMSKAVSISEIVCRVELIATSFVHKARGKTLQTPSQNRTCRFSASGSSEKSPRQNHELRLSERSLLFRLQVRTRRLRQNLTFLPAPSLHRHYPASSLL